MHSYKHERHIQQTCQFHFCQSVLHRNQTVRSNQIPRPLPHREEKKATFPGGCRMSAADTAEPRAALCLSHTAAASISEPDKK